MAFDLDAFRAAHQPWAFTVGRRTFGAQHVSAIRVMEYEARLHASIALAKQSPRAGAAAQRRALSYLLRAAFPWRFSYLIRGDPVHIIEHLEPAARLEVLKDFFACLRGMPVPARGAPNLPPTLHETRGTTLRERTPPRSA